MKSLLTKRPIMPRFNFGFAFIVALIVTFFSFNKTIKADELPFCPGEKLTFRLKWNFIPAGTAVLEVLPMENINGVKYHHFVMTTETNSFVDRIYKVRNRIDSYTDQDITHTVLYKKNELEGNLQSKTVVTFNWKDKEALYSNSGRQKKPVPIFTGTFDPFSIFYYVRLLDLEEDLEITRPVTDGKKCVIGKAKIIKKTTVTLDAKKHEAYLIEPHLKNIRGVFAKNKKAKIRLWVTADQRRIPIKIKSKIKIGSFTGVLISAENLAEEKPPASVIASRMPN
jgi:hypothetical protein